MNKDWNTLNLGNKFYFDIAVGGTPSKRENTFWKNGTINWVRSADLTRKYLFKTEKRITKEGLENSAAKLLPKGAIIISSRVSLGNCAIAGEEMTTSQDCTGIIIKSNEINVEYLYYVMKNHGERIKRIGEGSAIKGITQEVIQGISILVPPLAEQLKIADVLGTVDSAIEKTEQLIRLKEEYKKGMMQNYIQRNVRGVEKIKFRLHEIIKPIKRSIQNRNDLPVLSITARVGFVDQKEKFSKVIAGKNLEKYVLLKKGEFSYNKGNSKSYPQGCIYRLDEFNEAAVPNVYFSFEVNANKIDSDYFKYFAELGCLNRSIAQIVNTGVRNNGLLNIDQEDFYNIKVRLPEINFQRIVSSVLVELDKELVLLKKKLELLKTQKKGLMQQLLTGKIRVKIKGGNPPSPRLDPTPRLRTTCRRTEGR